MKKIARRSTVAVPRVALSLLALLALPAGCRKSGETAPSSDREAAKAGVDGRSPGAGESRAPDAKDAKAAKAANAAAGVDAGTVRPTKTRAGGTDVTFFVVSDTHFGFGDIESTNVGLAKTLNGLAGKPYPASVGGKVGAPRGLLITGDLTEWGKVDEWEPFVKTYGLTGTDGVLRMPVYEVIGNHDKVHGPWVEQQVAARHGGKRFYTVDWADLHIIALGEAPDEEGLTFLKNDLATVAPDVPVVLYFHLALEGPWSTGNWFGDGDSKERLAKTISGHSIVAIFHGHHHATGHYVWNGIDVFKPGAVKNDAHTAAVVHVTDDRFTLASYDYDANRWSGQFSKSLDWQAGRALASRRGAVGNQ